jgi:hypothetical protein
MKVIRQFGWFIANLLKNETIRWTTLTYNHVEGDNRLSPDLQDVYARSTTPDNRKRDDILLCTYRDYKSILMSLLYFLVLISVWNLIRSIFSY